MKLSASLAAALGASVALAAPAPQVNVTLYSESLCPDCVHFIDGVWWEAYNTQGIGYGAKKGDGQGIIAFNQVVWGNARLSADNKTVTCQHGATECLYNTLESCAVSHYPAVAQWLPFIHCLEGYIAGGNPTTADAKKCAADVGMTWAVLDKCWTSAEGHALDVANAFATAALQPPHQFVPWVTLSDAPGAGTFCTENGCDNFIQAVCDAYTGEKPAACPAEAAAAPRPALRGGDAPATAAGCPAEW